MIVTTPQDVATLDSKKAIKFVEKLGIPVLGVIENMSGMICPHCGEEIDLFGKGGGKKIAEELSVPFLGAIPLDIDMRKAGTKGDRLLSGAGTVRRGQVWTRSWNHLSGLLRDDQRGVPGGPLSGKSPLPWYESFMAFIGKIVNQRSMEQH